MLLAASLRHIGLGQHGMSVETEVTLRILVSQSN